MGTDCYVGPGRRPVCALLVGVMLMVGTSRALAQGPARPLAPSDMALHDAGSRDARPREAVPHRAAPREAGSHDGARRDAGPHDAPLAVDALEAERVQLRQALDRARADGHQAREREMLAALAKVLVALSVRSMTTRADLPKALAYTLEALPIRRALHDRRGESRTLARAASLAEMLGEYQQALEYHQAALAIAREIDDRCGEGQTLSDLGGLLFVLGRLPEAIDTLKEAQRMLRLVGDRAGEANVLRNMGRFEYAAGHRPAALARAREALTLYRAVDDRPGEAATLAFLARMDNDAGDHSGALRAGVVAQALCQSVGADFCMTVTSTAIGRAATGLGQWDRAEHQLRQALDLYRAQRNPSGESSALYDLAVFERARGRLNAALDYINARLAIIESARVRVFSEALRASYLAARHDTYAFTIDLLMQMHAREPWLRYDVAAFETSERARARSLLDLLVESSADAHTRPRDTSQVPLDRMTNGGARPLTAAEIQQALVDDDTVLLQFALGATRSRLWVVTQYTVTSYALPGQAKIEAEARRVHALLTVSQTRQRVIEARHASADLGEMLLGAVAPRLRAKRLAIVADGALQFVPFGALRVNGVPLILRHEIVNLPSASTLAVLRRELGARPPAPRLAAVLADPVLDPTDPRVKNRGAALQASAPATADAPIRDLVRSVVDGGATRFERLVYTRREAEAIHRLAGDADSFVALDFNANREAVTQANLGQYRILHFATHALLNSRQPEQSGLVLSLVDEQGRPRDGFLRSPDIYSLRLNADLVVLSACRTALGQEMKGEGLIGLVRAFMYAGSPRVVASLWDVRDEATAVLMDRFYTGMIRDGLAPAAALRAAQVWMARSERWSAPYYWAGFVLQGEWR